MYLKTTLHLLASYCTLHLASNIILIDTKDVSARPGTIWALVANYGSQGMSIWHACVDFICSPSDKLLHRSFSAILIFLTGVPVRTKCPVYPESEMDISTAIWYWVCWTSFGPGCYLFKWFVSMTFLLLSKWFYWDLFSYLLHHFWWRNHLTSQRLVPYWLYVTTVFLSSLSRKW